MVRSSRVVALIEISKRKAVISVHHLGGVHAIRMRIDTSFRLALSALSANAMSILNEFCCSIHNIHTYIVSCKNVLLKNSHTFCSIINAISLLVKYRSACLSSCPTSLRNPLSSPAHVDCNCFMPSATLSVLWSMLRRRSSMLR